MAPCSAALVTGPGSVDGVAARPCLAHAAGAASAGRPRLPGAGVSADAPLAARHAQRRRGPRVGRPPSSALGAAPATPRETAGGRPRPRPLAHAGGALRLHAAGRPGRRGDQDRGAGWRRSHARDGAAVPPRRGQRLLSGHQPQQEIARHRSHAADGARPVPRAGARRGRRLGELSARRHGAPGLRLSTPGCRQPARDPVLDLGLRRRTDPTGTGRPSTWRCRRWGAR